MKQLDTSALSVSACARYSTPRRMPSAGHNAGAECRDTRRRALKTQNLGLCRRLLEVEPLVLRQVAVARRAIEHRQHADQRQYGHEHQQPVLALHTIPPKSLKLSAARCLRCDTRAAPHDPGSIATNLNTRAG